MKQIRNNYKLYSENTKRVRELERYKEDKELYLEEYKIC